MAQPQMQPQMQPQNQPQPQPSYEHRPQPQPAPAPEPQPAHRPQPGYEQRKSLWEATRILGDVESQPLRQQLYRYKHLRLEEHELRGKVHFLETQVARAGYIQTPVSLAYQLKAEKAKLAQVQSELKSLVARLQSFVELPLEERAGIDVDRLTRLIDEIQAKREQEVIYQDNIYYLEELQAQIGLAVRVDLFNELKATREKLLSIEQELDHLKKEVKDEWDVTEPPFFSSIDTLSSDKLLELTRELSLRKLQKRFPHIDLQPPSSLDSLIAELDALRKNQAPTTREESQDPPGTMLTF